MEVPEFNSSEMAKENKQMIKILKDGADAYFIEAKRILVEALANEEYKNKKRYDVLRTQEFCQKVKGIVSEYIKN